MIVQWLERAYDACLQIDALWQRASERAATSHWPDAHDERRDEEETDDAGAGDDDEELRAVQLAVRRSLCARKTHWFINYELDAVLFAYVRAYIRNRNYTTFTYMYMYIMIDYSITLFFSHTRISRVKGAMKGQAQWA